MADTSKPLFQTEMELVQKWVDGKVLYEDLPLLVKEALDEVFPIESETEKAPEQAVQHLDLLHKADDEHRFTLGPWYIPNRYDAHGEWTDATELQSALWDYVKSGDRDIRLQHNRDIVAGEWLEAMSFPVPVSIGMTKSGSGEQVVYPSGTVFLGVQWKPWAWDMVKAGKIRGFSIGGAAARIEMDMPDDVFKATFGGDRSEAGRYAANARWRGRITAKTQGAKNLKARMERKKPEGVKNTFYRENEDKLLREERRANENLVDDTTTQAVSLPSGKTAILSGRKLSTTKFPNEGLVVGRGRSLGSPKSTGKPSGKKPSQFLQSGYGGSPVKKRPKLSKSDESLRFKVQVDAKISSAMKKNSPTSTAVHTDTIMGGQKKKKKKTSVSIDDVEKRGGLGKWFDEKWVDISRPKDGGGFEDCGRPDAKPGGKYPKCVPSATASSMSEKERKSAIRRKRKAETKGDRKGNAPINVKTFSKSSKGPCWDGYRQDGFKKGKSGKMVPNCVPVGAVKKAVVKKSKNVPTDKELYARVKAEARQKFDVYPSAYANAWLVREYKKRGGGYRVTKASSPTWQTKEGKNPKGGLNAKGRASYKRETGGTLRPPVKRGDNPRRASFLARMGNNNGAERDANGKPTRLLLSLQAWGANSKEEARKKAKAISARNKVKDEMRKASFAGNRSLAGQYAANIRWQREATSKGKAKLPTTKAGKILKDAARSLVTHCDLDGLAKELSAKGLLIDSVEAPEIVMKYLTKEKRAEIKAFVTEATSGIPANPDGPIVFIKGGGGAAGKSSSAGSMTEVPPSKDNKEGLPPKAVMSNADDYKVASKGFQQLRDKALIEANKEIVKQKISDPEKQEDVRQKFFEKYLPSPFVHEESSIVAKLINAKAMANGQDLIVDGTMDNGLKKRNQELDEFRRAGAREIHGYFYSCDTDTAVKRSSARGRKQGGKDYGRLVPDFALRAAHKGVSVNFPSYVSESKFDSIVLYDTNDKPNRMIAQTGEGGFVVFNQKLYDRFLSKASETA